MNRTNMDTEFFVQLEKMPWKLIIVFIEIQYRMSH